MVQTHNWQWNTTVLHNILLTAWATCHMVSKFTIFLCLECIFTFHSSLSSYKFIFKKKKNSGNNCGSGLRFWYKVQTENWCFPTLLRNEGTSVTWNTFWLTERYMVVINVIYHHKNTKHMLLIMPQTYFCYFMSHLCWMNLYFFINVTLSSKNWVCKFNIIVLIFEVLMAVIIKILSSQMWCHAVTKKLPLFYRDLQPPFLHYRNRLS